MSNRFMFLIIRSQKQNHRFNFYRINNFSSKNIAIEWVYYFLEKFFFRSNKVLKTIVRSRFAEPN